jgi:hypothetical protein
VEAASINRGYIVTRACGESPKTVDSSLRLKAGGGVEGEV